MPISDGQRRADFFIKHINLAGKEDMVVDVSVIHEFHGDMMRDVRRNGISCHLDSSSSPLDSKAKEKVDTHREE